MTDRALTGSEIAVIGMATRFPDAPDLAAFWRNLRGGVESIRRFSDDELEISPVMPAGMRQHRDFVPAGAALDAALVDGLDHELFGLSPHEARLADPQQRVVLECAFSALEDAGYDSARYPGKIACYAGVGQSGHQLRLLEHAANEPAALFEAMGTAAAENTAMRLSYKLKLRGESMTVYTACSTGLTVVHMACQSLLLRQADMALACGVKISVPQRAGYLYQDGMIFSRDGHCRPFDHRAGGTVAGNGAGCVLLKPLADAIADRDHIYAVLLGSAINNDADAKVGYTAPSVSGQADVIAQALAYAEVDADSIGLVEAHGTGTSLGDPIEVAALTQVYQRATSRTGYCALGSVKANIGHLDTAAGIAGLIKAVLSVHHGEIAPTLHFERPNPALHLDASPFFVPTALAAWPSDGPRRAGVSSFGIGGTNVHAILEEPPVRDAVPSRRPSQLVALSARTPAALDAMAGQLAEHLASHDVDPADAAFTRNVGRRQLAHRRAIVGASRDELIGELRARATKPLAGERLSSDVRVTLLFPGQGGQAAGMAEQLYRAEPAFRREVDACAGMLAGELGFDIRDVLYGTDGARLVEPAIALPCLFTVEYALARLWASWGIAADAWLGHSYGEYAAACCAGVLSLADALRLAVVRGRLMSQLPPGAMLAVGLDEAELSAALPPQISLAAMNARGRCTVSGPVAAIEAFEAELGKRGVGALRLASRQAFHSPDVDAIVPGLVDAIGRIELRPPQRRFVSSLTGQWITSEEATSPQYWARQMREPVRFAAALDTLAADGRRIFVEAGPDQALTALTRTQLRGGDVVAVASLRRAGVAGSDHKALLGALGALWVAGCEIDWDAYYADEQRGRVALPVYPFERTTHRLATNGTLRIGAPIGPIDETQVTGAADAIATTVEPIAAIGTAAPPEPDAAAIELTEIEQRITAIWSDRLGVDAIGRHDSFLELGGNSLMAAQVLTRLREAFPVEVTLADLFETPTVAGIAARIDARLRVREGGAGAAPSAALPGEPILPRPRGDAIATSVVQARVLAIAAREPENPALSMPLVVAMRGALRVELLHRALCAVVARHEVLRTTYAPGGSIRIASELIVPLPVVDLRGAAAAHDEALRHARDEGNRPFDLRAGVVRATLLRTADDEHWFLITVHHVACDTWSLAVLMRELAALYTAGVDGRAAQLPPLAVQYADFAAWQRRALATDAFAAQHDWWADQLDTPPAPLDLPSDVSPRADTERTFHGGRVLFRISRELTRAVHAFGESHGATPFMTMITAFAALLSRASGAEDVVIGTPIGNRSRAELEPLVGYVAHSVALRIDLSSDPSFAELVARARRTTLDAYANPDLPYEALVPDSDAAPLFDAVFVLQGAFTAPPMPGLTLEVVEVPDGPAQWGTTLAHLAISMGEDADGLHGVLEYNAARFTAETAALLIARMQRLLAAGLARPDTRLWALEAATLDERRALPPAARDERTGTLAFSLSYFANDEDEASNEASNEASRSKYALLLEGARVADRHGFAAVWTPERHFHAFGGLYPAPAVIGGALAAITERIHIRAGSVVLPLHDPIRVAEEWSVIDNLSGGRVGVSFAPGWNARDFALAPDAAYAYERRRQLLLEGVATVRALWRGEAIRRRSGTGEEVELRVRPRPVQHELPIWLTAAGNPETFRTAGELGANVLTNLMGQTLESLGDKIALYRRSWREAGHAGRGHITVMMHAFVGDDERAVRAVVREPLLRYFRSSVDVFAGFAASHGLAVDVASLSERDMRALVEHGFDRYIEAAGVFGTPESCAPVLDRLHAVDADELACLVDFGVALAPTLASIERLAALRDGWNRPVAAITVDPDRIVDAVGRPLPWGLVGALAGTGTRARARREGVIDGIAAPAPRRRPHALGPVPRGGAQPLSFAQERLWYLDQLEPHNVAYNNPVAMRLDGRLDAAALERAINEVVRRHEVLRTRIAVDDGRPSQVILPALALAIPVIDLAEPSDSPDRAAAADPYGEAMARASQDARRSFALDTAPLVRVTLFRIAGDQHVLLVVMHHIVSDGWSAGVLLHELAVLYAAFARGAASPLPELGVQYADYAVWQRAELMRGAPARHLAAWRDRLAGLPVLELAGDRPRPAVRSFAGARHPVVIPAVLTSALAALVKDDGATPFMGLCAALEAVLQRYTGQRDFGIGTPVAGRSRPELEPMVGCFINTIVLRADLSGRPSFRELVRRVRQDALGAYALQDVPFERVVDALGTPRDVGVPALFQVMLVLHNTPVARAELPGLRLEGIELETGASKLDLSLELRETDGELRGAFEYNADLFDGETVARFADHFTALLGAALAAPEHALDTLEMLSAGERAQLVSTWATGEAIVATEPSLPALFEAQAVRVPEAVAVVSPHERVTLSYRELDQRADALARALVEAGVATGDRVAVAIERSADFIVAVLATLKAGAAYVPIDPQYPDARIAQMIDDAGVRVVVARGAAVDWLSQLSGAPVIGVETRAASVAVRAARALRADDLAYVLYTSGSTGVPKGVGVPHRAVVRLAMSLCGDAVRDSDAMLLLANPVFDASSLELWGALVAGARAVVYPPGPFSVDELAGFLGKHAITTAAMTAGVFQLVAERPADLRGVRWLAVGGDAMSAASARRVLDANPALRLVNSYGPTEAATAVTAYEMVCTGDVRDPVPLGRPIANTRVYVLDRALDPVACGVPGELCIAGDALAHGYLGRAAATAAAFAPDPFGAPGARLYRTGDRARWRPDGTLEFLGRVDRQVKIRGFRVELDEIEAVLRAHGDVRDCAVVAHDGRGGRRLVAYVAGSTEGLPAHLKQQLPEWMIPSAFVELSALPLLPTGKLDRRALPAPDAAPASGETAAPEGAAERAIAAIWADVLGIAEVGRHDNFFALGGDSISSIRVIARARELGLHLTPRQMFQHQTVAEQAAAASSVAIAAEQGVVTGGVPPTPIVRWFFAQDLPERHHFNLSVRLALPTATTAAQVDAALAALALHHDALRSRFRAGDRGVEHMLAAPDGNSLLCSFSDVQRAFDLEHGPLIRGALIDGELVLVVHHAVLDGVSWPIVLDDFARVLGQVSRGEPVRLPAKTTSFRAWAERLAAYAQGDQLAGERAFWDAQVADPTALALPVDRLGSNRQGDARKLTVELDAGDTAALLADHPRDRLLAALAQTLTAWSGHRTVAIDIESHGREHEFDNVDVSRTVGWFTAVYPLAFDPSGDPSAALAAIAQRLRAVPGGGLGYGALRYGSAHGESLAKRGSPQVTFNYLGHIELAGRGVVDGERGVERSPLGVRSHLLEIDAALVDGRLRVMWTYGRAIHDAQTIERLADELIARLRALRSANVPAAAQRSDIPVIARGGAMPLSFMQERLWFLDQLEPDSTLLTTPFAVRLHGRLDVARLERALAALIARHESLRCAFPTVDGIPTAVVIAEFRTELAVTDFSALSPDERAAAADAAWLAEGSRTFSLATGPVVRARLLRLSDDEHVLVVSAHHIVSDGWSGAILLAELGQLYAGAVLPPLAVQYADYAAWARDRMQGERLERQLAYWQHELAGAPPVTELPTDRPRPRIQSYRGETVTRRIGGEVYGGVRAVCRAEGATPFMALLAAFSALVARWSGQSDLVIGAPVGGRPRRELEAVVGPFLNTVAVRVAVDGAAPFGALVAQVKQKAIDAVGHQEVPFEKVLERVAPPRDLSRTPVFQLFFNMLNYPTALAALPGLQLDVLTSPMLPSKFDLTVYAREDGDGAELQLVYNADLFDRARIEELAAQYELLLAQCAGDPARPLDACSLVTARGRAELPDPSAPLDATWHGAIHDHLSRQAARAPEAVAIVEPGAAWTYGMLEAASNRLAHQLRAAGAGPGGVVAIWAHRSGALVWALMAGLKTGGAILVLDPAYPEPSLVERLALARPCAIVQLAGARPIGSAVRAWLAEHPACSVVALPAQPSGAGDPRPPAVEVGPDDVACIGFTSGSTGVAKGIVGLHRSLTHFVPWQARELGIDARDRFTMLSGLAHDPLQRDVFTAIQLGAAICVPDPDHMAEPGWLARWAIEQRVSVANLTPAMVQLLTDGAAHSRIASLRLAFVVGDALRRRDVERLTALAPGVRVINLYGTTETQRALGYHVADGTPRDVEPLGRGMPGAQLLVLGAGDRHAGIAEVGEIIVRSPHLARGYLADDALTQRVFAHNPFTGAAGDRIYRTGDLGRYLPGGEVEWVGRADRQIQVRGFRVEPAAIETILQRHPGVRDAAVIARALDGDEISLVAYVVGGVAEPELRRHVAAQLPSYMVPSVFIELARLPITPAGKLDRAALPAPVRPDAGTAPAPLAPEHAALAAIWSELLGVRAVAPDDDFFALGGHSLRATQLVSRLRDRLGVELPVRAVFEASTLAAMSARIATAAPTAEQRLAARARPAILPLSFAQQRHWFLEQLDPGSPLYNIPFAVRLVGPLDPRALERALAEILRRHEVLRTRYVADGGVPRQVIDPADAPSAQLQLRYEDATAADLDTLVHRLAEDTARRGFDLAAGSVLRALLARIAADEHLFVLVVHHIAFDAWSVGVLVTELAALYAAFIAGRPSPLPELAVQYADFALAQGEWLRGPAYPEELAYWKRELAGAAALDLPADRPRPVRPSLRAGRIPFEVPASLRGELEQLARGEGATPFILIAAALLALLHRYTGQDDISIGSPVAGRTSSDIEPLVGTFVNTLVLRADLSSDPTFRELVAQIRGVALAAYAHQNVPFDKLVEELAPRREQARQPLFQVMLVMQNVPMPELVAPGLAFVPVPLDTGTSKFDLTLTVMPDGDRWRASCEYSADIFDEDRIARLVQHLQNLLAAIARDPAERVSRLPLLTARERRSTVAVRGAARCLHERFADQAARRPDAIALGCAGAEVSYRELDRQSDAIARRLARIGVGLETRVALCIERSPALVAGILGILKAGAAYVPLDPDYPRERLALLVTDARAPVIVTSRALRDRLPASDARVICVEDLDATEDSPPLARAVPDSAAYVIYTSGSTGRPKGVVVTHAQVGRLLDATESWFAFDERDVWTLFHSFAFDFSVWELWGALAYGGRLVVVPYEVSRAPEAFLALLASERVTVLNQTPSAFRQLVHAERAASPALALRYVIFGGEALDLDTLAPWFARHGDQRPRLINMYGITETTVHVTYRPLSNTDAAGRGSPIGVAIPDLRVYLLDRHGEPVPLGVAGEIYVGGAGVARGYLDRPGLTAQRFVPDPFGAPGARLYRSGDLARQLANGELEYLGRIDDQVKVRGFRIELGEIEVALRGHPRVDDCVVIVREDEPGDQRLVAYVVGESAAAELRAHLQQTLPEHMIPAAFIVLDRLPLTPHGKLDRRALPAPSSERPDLGTAAVAPRGATQQALAQLFGDVLGLASVGAEDSFFELGGHSLLAVQLVSRIRDALGAELPLRAVFESPTVAALAALVAGTAAPAADQPIHTVPRDAPMALSFMQERLWFLQQYEPAGTALNMPVAVRVRGPLDPSQLARALDQLAARHEVLRCRFRDVGGVPVAVVAESPPIDLPVIALDGEPAVAAALAREAAQPFALADAPPWRVRLWRLAADEHVVSLIVHHVACDGWSLGVLIGELAELYARGALPALPVGYADYAAWQRERLAGERLERELAYWRDQLRGAPAETALPSDRARPRVQTFRGERVRRAIAAEPARAIRAVGQASGATVFMVLLAAFDALVARWTGQTDIVIGAPVAGRPRRELEGVVGPFLNTVALRVSTDGEPSFAALVARVREAALGAYQHQDLPFEKVLEAIQPPRDLSRTPVFQLFFNMLNVPLPSVGVEGLRFEPLSSPDVAAKFDVTVYIAEAAGALELEVVYNADLHDRERIEELADQYVQLLAAFAADPAQPIHRASLVTPRGRSMLPDPTSPLDDTWRGAIHDHLSRHAQLAPDALAIVDRDDTWTYGELEAACNQLARQLGAGSGDVIAVWAHRSAPLVWAVMAALKTGSTVMLLDPAYPAPSLVARLALARPRALLVQTAAPPPDSEVAAWLAANPSCAQIAIPRRPSAADPWAAQSPEPPGISVGPNDAACLSFTSGSTGEPKGIVGMHRSLTHFVPWQARELGMRPVDRFGMLSALSHDPLQRDLFTALQLGATIAIPDPERMREPGWLASWAAAQRVSVVHLTPAMAQLLAEARPGTVLPELRLALVVGDVLTRRDTERVRSIAPAVRCVNLYGSTETQRAVGYHLVQPGPHRRREALPLGRGIPGVQLLVITPAGLAGLAGIGEVGEIAVRSPHMARGYLGDPEQTQRKFTANPFTGRDDDRIYRTGDVGRYLPDGDVEWVGRADRQVKVRGFRIELGEIEGALSRHPSVREAVVIAIAGPEVALAAYVVPRDVIDQSALRSYLAARLPDYMVPAAFVELAQLPLTHTGKVDRAALPAPVRSRAERPAETATQRALAALWAELLGANAVWLDDDFFALGGHSLRATQLLARVRSALGVELAVRSIFEAPTLEAFAARVDDAVLAGARIAGPPLTRASDAERTQPVPLSFAQQRLWFLDQLDPGTAQYHVALGLRATGRLDIAALERALAAVVHRHEVLRTRLVSDDGRPRQIIVPAGEAELRLERDDLRAWPAGDREAEARRRAAAEARRSFALDRAPLVRARLIQLADDQSLLIAVVHHIACDGWSVGVLGNELVAHYTAVVSGRPLALPELAVQYADYARWQRRWLTGDTLDAQLAYWRGELAGAPPLELPTDRPRPARPSLHGARHSIVVPSALSAALRELGHHHGATSFMVLLAAFDVLLHKTAGQSDFCIGTPIAGRTRVELEPLIGCFVNTLVLRADLAGDPTFVELLARVRRTALGAFAHQDIAFEKLVEVLAPRRELGRQPLFQAMFVLQNAPVASAALPGLQLDALAVDTQAAKFDLSLEIAETPRGMRATFMYRTDLFDAARIERMAGHFERLLGEIAADPARRISALPWLTEVEHGQLAAWAGRVEPVAANMSPSMSPSMSIDELLARGAPSAPAIAYGDRVLTYRDLALGVRRVAHQLRTLGVGPGDIVGLRIDRSPAMIVGLLGIIAAGAAFLPIDPAHPLARAALALRDAKARVLLTRAQWLDALDIDGMRAIAIEAALETVAGDSPAGSSQARPDDLAYVIYTSGTTGRPKGVMITRRNLASLVSAVIGRFGLGATDRVLQLASISFDVAVREIFPTLAAGACIVVPPTAGPPAFDQLAPLLTAHAVTVVSMPASYWHEWVAELLEQPRALPASLRLVTAGSERVSPERWRQWQRIAGSQIRLLDSYGPTEITVTATAYDAADELPALAAVPIGRPLANTTARVLDERLAPAPIGVAGELWIGGLGVARGYLGQPMLTAERFAPDPFGPPGSRMYRTGDRASVLPDGNLAFLGRIDRQLKVRGFRIEPQEIERALEDHPQVREAVVAAHDGALVGYVTPVEAPSPAELRKHLADRLPPAWLPSAFVQLDRIPVLSHGKVDWSALPAPEAAPADPFAFVAPASAAERALAQIWSELLGVERIGRDDDFFALGGHSLLALQVVARARRAGLAFDAADMIEAPTLRGLAERAGQSRARSPLVALQPRGAHTPLFIVHPHGGRALCYRDLAALLGPDQPVFGLEAAGVDGREPPLERIEDMAARHLAAIRAQQPHGPYAIGGWSYGGLVALEIAQQLTRDAERAHLLVLDTSLTGTFGDTAPATDGVVGMMARALEALTGTDVSTGRAVLSALPDREAQLAYLVERATALGEGAVADARALLEVVEANSRAWRRYAPARYDGGILMLRTEHPPGLRADDPTLGWGRIAGALELRRVPGTHHRLVFEPEVRGIIEHIRGWLATVR